MNMKINIKYRLLSVIVLLVMAAFTTGCSDDDEVFTNEVGSSIEIKKHVKISRFSLDAKYWQLADSVKTFTIHLQSMSDDTAIQFDAEVFHKDNERFFHIVIPSNKKIPDSDYKMVGLNNENKIIGRVLEVTFKDEMLTAVLGVTYSYHELKHGSGTKEDPYAITKLEDFDIFRLALSEDPSKAKGLYFVQKVPRLSVSYTTGTVDGHGYKGYDFAGHYDGNGHTIKIEHIGSTDDCGMFSQLLEGAEVKDLIIEGKIMQAGNRVGFLAGSSNGNVLVDNVKVDGNIHYDKNTGGKGYSIGGLIGEQKSGVLKVVSCRIGASITGRNDVAGVVGKLVQGTLNVENVERKSATSLSIEGQYNVGFICGYIESGEVHLKDVSLTYTTAQGANIQILQCSEDGLGGLIGSANKLIGNSTIESCSVNCPIDGNSSVGGLCGKINAEGHLTLNDCEVSSTKIIGKGNHVGGVVGKLSMNDSYTLTLKKRIDISNGTISGNAFVGGMFGSLTAKNLTISTEEPFNVNVNVTAKDYRAGSICGEMFKTSLPVYKRYFKLPSTNTVEATRDAGGIVGFCENVEIIGEVESNVYFPQIVTKDKFKPFSTFDGIVTRINDDEGESLGGLVGAAFYSNIHNVCFGGTLVGNVQIGGIIGYARDTKLNHCVNISEKVDCKTKHAGGIVGKINSLKNSKTLTCNYLLNYANIGRTDFMPDNAGGYYRCGQ